MRHSFSLGLALALMLLGPAHAQNAWPAKPIRLIVGFAAGGSTDVTARIIAQALSDRLGQPVVVENRGGAGGNIGADAVAKADPDGYTLLMATSSTFAANPNLYKTLPFDVQKDFAPITLTTLVPQVLVASPALEAKNIKELIALAKAHPGKINYGTGGNGSANHLAVELMAASAESGEERSGGDSSWPGLGFGPARV
jgi:tripartite-type tricarboxylate transporter receptor subunit TctC